jgi:DNA replication ATP-dependent helicase Dna2
MSSQVAESSLAFSCLKPSGRLVVIGDSLQLAPISAFKFPRPPPGVPLMHSSVLECLTRSEDTNGPLDLLAVVRGVVPTPAALVKLRENYRMNEGLSRFTARLYGRDYAPPQGSSRRNGRWPVATASEAGQALMALLPEVLTEDGYLPEMLAIRLVPRRQGTGEILGPDDLVMTSVLDHVQAEAAVVARLMEALSLSHRRYAPKKAARQIFAVTPHRRQKAAVCGALGAGAAGLAWEGAVDTVERMQGQERELVVICLGFFDVGAVSRERDFLYSKERLNVAISRAQQCCVVVYTDVVLALNPDVVAKPDCNVALTHLRAFVSEAQRADAFMDL